MRRIGMVVKVVLVGVLVGAVVLAGVVGAVFVTHPRNEGAYLRYVHRFGDDNGRHAKGPVATDAQLLAAGDRACTWLKHRQPALWRYGPDHEINSLGGRYEKQRSTADRALPRSVVPGAWEHLCPAVKELVGPHRLWPRSND
jgi:hypothetical protein